MEFYEPGRLHVVAVDGEDTQDEQSCVGRDQPVALLR